MPDIDEDVRVLSEALAAPVMTSERWNSLCDPMRISSLLDALQSERARADAAERERDAMKREAQIWAQEAKTQRATVQEAYRVCTGGTGEPGDWNGAEPIRALAEHAHHLEGALHSLKFWVQSYPLTAISAPDVRHVITKVGQILDAALSQPAPQGENHG